MKKEATLYRKEGEYVICEACARECKLKDNQVGFCGVRKNENGKLYLLNYGVLSAIHIDPIEKKPFLHYYPGSWILSVGSTGCSWACQYCQNYDISQRRKVEGIEVTPEKIVDLAIKTKSIGIAYTYNEPSTFIEFAHDTGLLAKEKGLKNAFVTNGYYTDKTINYLKEFLDAATIDLKGNGELDFLRRYTTASSIEPVLNAIKKLYSLGIHIEITDLVVPKIGDNLNALDKILDFIGEIDKNIPIHFLRFFPEYKLNYLEPTPIETLEKHYELAKKKGFKFVYIGNVPGHEAENTYCPKCKNVVIKREGLSVVECHVKDGKCEYCGEKLPIEGECKVNNGEIISFFDLV